VKKVVNLKGRALSACGSLLALLCLVGGAGAGEPCGLCDEKIVTNSVLASCFLDEFPQFAGKANGAIVVDLSSCEQSRGVVDPLPMPGMEAVEPDLQFILTRDQLVCLKAKLEQPGLVLDPSATIELGSCG
jgi:hypothetical protein